MMNVMIKSDTYITMQDIGGSEAFLLWLIKIATIFLALCSTYMLFFCPFF